MKQLINMCEVRICKYIFVLSYWCKIYINFEKEFTGKGGKHLCKSILAQHEENDECFLGNTMQRPQRVNSLIRRNKWQQMQEKNSFLTYHTLIIVPHIPRTLLMVAAVL